MKYFVVLILSLVGLFLAFYIKNKKNKEQPMVCLVGHDCNEVVNSRYSKIFGIKNENLGIVYYFIIIIFSVLTIGGVVWPAIIIWGLNAAAIGAALFSLYLIGVQAFALREWCMWCLGSALISLVISLSLFFL